MFQIQSTGKNKTALHILCIDINLVIQVHVCSLVHSFKDPLLQIINRECISCIVLYKWLVPEDQWIKNLSLKWLSQNGSNIGKANFLLIHDTHIIRNSEFTTGLMVQTFQLITLSYTKIYLLILVNIYEMHEYAFPSKIEFSE